MGNIYKLITLTGSTGLGFVLLCLSVVSAQPADKTIELPPILPGIVEPPRIQGITTELPGNLYFTPEMEATMEKAREQVRQQGYVEIDEARVLALDIRSRNLKGQKANNDVIESMNEIIPTLGFKPVDLRFSPLGKADLLEGKPSGANINGKWSEFNRLFELKNLGLVELNEWDYHFDQGGMYVNPEAINQNVNGHPATLLVEQGPSGRGLTKLTWWDEQKVYKLTVNRPLRSKQGVDELIHLAESIQ